MSVPSLDHLKDLLLWLKLTVAEKQEETFPMQQCAAIKRIHILFLDTRTAKSKKSKILLDRVEEERKFYRVGAEGQ